MTDREHITNRAHGIDVSHWQEEFILDRTWGQVDFAIAKIGEGYNTPYHEPYTETMNFDQFLRLWDEGVAKLDIRGVYHYQRSGYSWEAQASRVLEAVERLDVKPQMIWCDLEKINNTVDATMIGDTLRILDYWKRNSSYLVGLYSNPDIMDNFVYPIGLNRYGVDWINRLFAYPFWVSQYWNIFSPDKNPGMPKCKSNWNLYQYTDNGDCWEWRDGVKWRHYGSPDLNVFNGMVDDMKTWLVTGNMPGEPMYKVTVINTGGATERKTASISGISVKVWPKGSILYAPADEVPQIDGSKWILLESGNYLATFYNGTRRASVELIGEPPTAPTSTQTLTMPDGTQWLFTATGTKI